MRYALRTLCGPWLALVALPLEVANFCQRGVPWRGEGMWTVEWFAIVIFVLGPLAAGLAAVDAARLSRPGNVHLVVTTPRPWRPYVKAAAWCLVPLAAVHVLAIVTGLAYGAVTRPSVGWSALAGQVALQCLVLTWFVALGTGLGRFLPPMLAGLVTGVLAFLLTYLLGASAGDGHFALLGLGAATVSRLGLGYHPSYLVAQALLLVSTALCLLLVPTRGYRAMRVPSRAGSLLLSAALVLVVVGQVMLPAQRLTAAPAPPDVCVDAAVQVCFFHEHRLHADSLESSIDTLVSAARAKGYPAFVPDRVVESSRTFEGARPGTASFALPLATSLPGPPRLQDWVFELTNPTHCPALHVGAPPESYQRRKAQVEVTWLSLVGVRSDWLDEDSGLHVLTPEETAAVMADFRACRLA